jgi:hypothetical protein
MRKNRTGGVYPFTKINSMGERLTRSAVCTSLASSLAAALLDGLFEHSEVILGIPTVRNIPAILLASTKFSHSPVEEETW